MDTEEQWEVDVVVNKYCRFLVASYNRSYLSLNGENPILLRQSKATTDDVMTETMNENNWHNFLSDCIRGALDNSQAADENGLLHLEGQWIRNIFTRLNKCFRIYAMIFEELASTYKELLFSGAGNNRVKTDKSAEIPFKSFGSMQDEVSYEELYFKMAKKYFSMGKTPLSASPKNLPEIRPHSHLDSSTTLPNFSSLYRQFSDTPVKWMLISFFIMQVFQESVERSKSSKPVITNAFEELLFNYSTAR